MTVNVLPVSGILKELYDIQRDSEKYHMIKWKQYITVLIMIRMAKDIRRCYSYNCTL